MADLSITGSNVQPTASTEYVDPAGVAGEVIAAGEMVFKLASDNKYYLAEASAEANINAVGMAMNPAVAAGQPIVVAKGVITIGTGFTVGMQVNLSQNPGKLAPVADISTNFVVACGCIVSSTTVKILINNYAIAHA